jgi:hypothetical protein
MSQSKRSQKKREEQTQSNDDLNYDPRTVRHLVSVYDAVAGSNIDAQQSFYSDTDMAD